MNDDAMCPSACSSYAAQSSASPVPRTITRCEDPVRWCRSTCGIAGAAAAAIKARNSGAWSAPCQKPHRSLAFSALPAGECARSGVVRSVAGMSDRMGFVERILREAIALPPHERAGFVDRSCGEDPRARQLLQTLLFSPEDQIAASASAADVETRTDGSSHCPDRARRSVAQGRYEIGHKLGSGGQKDVYLARDTRLHRQVVVSFVRQNPDPSRLERFLREARAMAQHNMPTIPPEVASKVQKAIHTK